MKRYRQTMTITFDVCADDEREATRLIQECYEDMDTVDWWSPDTTVIVPDSDDFDPIN
jgi:hypothetical protein